MGMQQTQATETLVCLNAISQIPLQKWHFHLCWPALLHGLTLNSTAVVAYGQPLPLVNQSALQSTSLTLGIHSVGLC